MKKKKLHYKQETRNDRVGYELTICGHKQYDTDQRRLLITSSRFLTTCQSCLRELNKKD